MSDRNSEGELAAVGSGLSIEIGNADEDDIEVAQPVIDAQTAMAEQDAKFKAKFGLGRPKPSQILQRRISKGGKGQYFDSGDYNVSKAAGGTVLGTDHPKPEIIRNKKLSAPSGPMGIPKHVRSSSGGEGGHPPSKLSPSSVTS